MRLLTKTAARALSLALSGCAVSGLLGGGGKPPVTLVTLTPEAREPAQIARSAGAGQAVTVATPSCPKSSARCVCRSRLRRATSNMSTNLQLVDTPDQAVRGPGRRDGAPHHQPSRARCRTKPTLDPGLTVERRAPALRLRCVDRAGRWSTYDGSLSTAGGNRVETRRFTATAAADGTSGTVGPALNRAANQVAHEVAKWIGG